MYAGTSSAVLILYDSYKDERIFIAALIIETIRYLVVVCIKKVQGKIQHMIIYVYAGCGMRLSDWTNLLEIVYKSLNSFLFFNVYFRAQFL